MRPKFTLLCMLFCLGFTFSNAQTCDDQSPPDQAAEGCACAFPDCDFGLNGFTGLLSTPNGNQTPIPECTSGNGGTFHNDDWISFIAGTESISITITPSNCNVVGGGQTGVQAGFYEACNDNPNLPNDEGVPAGGLLVQCNCSTAPLNLTFDNFVVGQSYYIFLDGCGGSVCDYVITVNSGSTTLGAPGALGGIMGPATVCPGQTVTYNVVEVPTVPDYDWQVTGGGVIQSQDGASVTVTWNGAGTLSTTGENACFTTNTVDFPVTVMPLPDVMATGSYCQGGAGYNFNGTFYLAGTWMIDEVLTAGPQAGCTQTTILTVTENPTYDETVRRTICFGDQVFYGGQPYSTAGDYDIDLLTFAGCDSLITLELTVLDPLSIVNLTPPLDEITCTSTSVLINGAQSFPAQSLETYVWTSPTGGDTSDGQGTPLLTVTEPGTYCLEVGYSAIDGESGQLVTCTNQSCIDVEEDVDAPMLSISHVDVSCGGAADGEATVTITGGQPPFLIAWTDDNNTTTQTVEDLPGGTYTVSVFSITNGCTASETVTILEPDGMTLDMGSTDSGCAGATTGTATVTASGGAGGYTYSWNTVPEQTTETAIDLAGGTYTVTVTDANNCTNENSVVVGQGAAMSVTIDGVDIECNGGDTGTATANGSGGTGMYTYSWNTVPEQTTQTATGLLAGMYVVVITDENDCTATETVTLTEADALVLVTDSSNPSCGSAADGEATVTASGGAGGYMYSWNSDPVQTTATATGLPAGTYTVVVTDANDCTNEAMVTLMEPAGVTVVTGFVDVECNGGDNGEASVSVSGGTTPYEYTWDSDPVQTTATATGLSAGTYMVTIEDANDCQVIETITVSEPPALTLVESGMDTDCNGTSNGEASVVASGGTPGAGYSYEWNSDPVQTTATATGLPAGTYTVVVTDANDCTETVDVTVGEPTVLTLVESGTDTDCNGTSNGEASVVVSGGTPGAGYSYEWNSDPVQTTATATGLPAGTYTLVVTDANDCTETVDVTIGEPTVLSLVIDGVNPECNTSTDGEASVVASGGTPGAGYSYEWDSDPVQTTATATGLPAGTYTVVVTDANDCSMTETVTITGPNALSLSTTQVDILCRGELTGEATVIATGGTAPLSYAWDDAAAQNTSTAVGLGAGLVTVVVTDDNGCSETISVTLTEPATALSASGTSTNALCGQANGTIDLTATGGTSPYTYDWGAEGTNEDLIDLGPGTYSVVVTDANACTTTVSVTVDSPDSPSATVQITNVTCNGEADGIMDITVTGGITPYTYAWTPFNNGDEDLESVVAGTYSVTVTDAAGCSVVANGVIEEPDALDATATASPADCGIDNGSISLVVSGGTTPYTFDWPGTVDDVQSPTDLAVGVYEVTITDANGCTILASDEVIIPDGPVTTITGTDVGCNGEATGTIDLTISGGAIPYTIVWNQVGMDGDQNLTDLPAGDYEVTVTDLNNCSSVSTIEIIEPIILSIQTSSTPVSCAGSTDGTTTVVIDGGTGPFTVEWCDGQTGTTALDCPAGPCTVTVTDANGCTVTGTVTVDEPPVLEATAVPTDADCNTAATGSIAVTTNGGTAPYGYNWTGGIAVDTESPTSLGAGIYEVTVNDANGCTMVISNIEITEPDAIDITFMTTDATCNQSNGTIDLTVTGGTGPYGYTWTGGLPSVEDPDAAATGTYEVTVRDANGCTATEMVTVSTPSALSISATFVDVDCNGASTGSADVTMSGGIPPFTYQWDDPDAQTVEDAIDLAVGTYNVVVTDNVGCTITTSVTISEPTALVLSATSTDATCNQSNGTIDLSVSGGVTPYTFDWSGSADDIEDPQGLSSGSYNVTVTDFNDCTAILSQSVDTPSGLSGDAQSQDAACFGDNNGSIDLNVVGGTGAGTYLYQWDDAAAQTIEDPIDLVAGDYVVTVTDGDGCTITVSATVGQPDLLTAAGISFDASCNEANGSIDLTVNGGTAPYSFDWMGAAGNVEDPQGLFSGSYPMMVRDANGCTATTTVVVNEPAALGLSAVPTDASCNGEASGSIDLAVTGGTGAGTYLYQWDDAAAQTIEDPIDLTAGMYNVVVTDGNGCTITTMVTIDEPQAIGTTATTVNEICGESNGSIDLTVSGGTAPYAFDWSDPAPDVEDPQGLQAGTYNVTVTDFNGCTFTNSVVVNTPNALLATATPTPAVCNGEASGSIELDIQGGTAPYTVIWSGGLGTVEDPQDVAAGIYNGIVSDADGCQIVVAATIDEPTAITAFSTSVEATCNETNGSIDLTVDGGIAPYTYVWDGGANPVEDPDNIGAGTYNVTITDANGCSLIYSESVSTPTALTLSSTKVDASCNGDTDGSIDLNVSGGVAPFTYDWDNGMDTEDLSNLGAGVYTVIVTDNDACTITTSVTILEPGVLVAVNDASINVGCNGDSDGSANIAVTGGTMPYDYDWSNNAFDGSANPSNMSAGTYTVTVTDFNGCTATEEVNITEPELLVLAATSTPATCFGGGGGAIDLTVTGGEGPFVYNWNSGTYVVQDPQGVSAGTFSVVVTDANGCTATTSVQVGQPTALLVNIDNVSNYGGTNVSCSDATDGSAEAFATGGTAPYIYTWSTGTNGQGVEDLGVGTYEVIVLDANGCTATNQVSLDGPVPVSMTTDISDPSCFGDNDGAIILEGTGGTSPYMYSLDGGALSSVNLFGGLVSGIYEVMIQDINGCEQVVEAILEDPIELVVDLGRDTTIQLGDSITLLTDTNVLTPTLLDTFFWNVPTMLEYQPQIIPTETATYTITVISDLGCVDQDDILVRVKKDRLVFVANIFTPNGDGNNDFVEVQAGSGVSNIKSFQIFNRWGEVMHEAFDYMPGAIQGQWEGTFKGETLNPGVFVYFAEVEFTDGRVELFKGDITLMK